MAVTQAIPMTRHPYADGSYKKMLIDGKWIDAASGKRFETHNPATGELLATVAEGDAEDINRAVAAARAQLEPPEGQIQVVVHHDGRLGRDLPELRDPRAQLRGDLVEPDRGLDRFNLTEERANPLKSVAPPVLQKPPRLRGHQPLVGIG